MAYDNVKNAAVIIVIIAVVALSYILFVQQPAAFEKGSGVNQETFLSLLSGADRINIVMDIRNASSEITSRNILQCGVDFASSTGLAGRNVTYMSMDDRDCFVGVNEKAEKRSIAECIAMLNSEGMSLYVLEGNETEYYTRAAMIGVNENYAVGTCSLR